MGTVSRKRTRRDISPPSSKRPPPPDSDIASSEAGTHSPPPSPPTSPPPSPHLALETPEEKRLRLARAYLRHAGVSSDAGISSSDDSDAASSDDAQKGRLDAGNQLLRERALQASGRLTRVLADAVGARIAEGTRLVGRGHALAPTCVQMDEGGTVAVSGGKDGRVIVWDVATGRRRDVWKARVVEETKRDPGRAGGHIGGVRAVAVAEDGRMAASGGEDGLVRVWDVRVGGGEVGCLRGHRGGVEGLAFRGSGGQLFSASGDRTVKVWDLGEMAYVETLFGHGAGVCGVDAMEKERAVSCGRDGTLRLYKVVEGSQLVFRRAMTVSIDAVAMVSEQRFVSGGDDGAVCLWQMNKKKPTAVVERAHGGGLGCDAWIASVAAFRNTDLVASGAGNGIVKFWKCEQVPKIVPVGELNVGAGFINGIAVARSQKVMALAVGNEHRLGRWQRLRGVRNTVQFVAIPEVAE